MILLAVTGLLLVSYASSLHAWWQQRAEIAAKEEQVASLEGDLEDIESEFSRWRDDAFLEQQARERFGWVMPGEVGYRVIGADGDPIGEVGDLTAREDLVTPEWHQSMWGSIEEAGLEPEEQEDVVDEGPDPDVILDIEGEQEQP